MNVKNPLRRGLFVQVDAREEVWISFKYENLSVFCFGYGRMSHNLKDCSEVLVDTKSLPEDDLLFSVAFKAENNLIEKVSQTLGTKLRRTKP